jgi:hypothetical protein
MDGIAAINAASSIILDLAADALRAKGFAAGFPLVAPWRLPTFKTGPTPKSRTIHGVRARPKGGDGGELEHRPVAAGTFTSWTGLHPMTPAPVP